MPHHVVDIVADALNAHARSIKGSRVLVLGVAYKANIDDVRESPALDVIDLLRRKGAEVRYHDPLVAKVEFDSGPLHSLPLEEGLGWTDCAVVITAHRSIDYRQVLAAVPLLVDTRNCLPGVKDPKLFRL